ncbi:MAG: GNAT family N-acetyltransferase [Anaerolineaceae bacterium]|nr:GNAT family N-acetyltransferase [Anaerolineaceae bacterium]
MLLEIIETKRLRLRPHGFHDIDDILAYATDPEWSRYLPVPHPYTRSDAEEFIASQILLDKEKHQAWAIERNGTVIGGINIRFQFKDRLGELGYSIARPHWGKGFATQAGKAVIDTSFSVHPELNRIQAYADARNTGSLRVMEKLGMTREGIFRQKRWVRDEFIDEAWCAVLRAEWEAKRD